MVLSFTLQKAIVGLDYSPRLDIGPISSFCAMGAVIGEIAWAQNVLSL